MVGLTRAVIPSGNDNLVLRGLGNNKACFFLSHAVTFFYGVTAAHPRDDGGAWVEGTFEGAML